jgi:replication factor A1
MLIKAITYPSQWSIRLTLWGKQAENFVHEDQPVIAAKGVKVGDFGGTSRRDEEWVVDKGAEAEHSDWGFCGAGRSLSMFSSSTMTIHPDIEQAHALKGW